MNSSGPDPRPLARGADALDDARLGDLALEHGWVTVAQLRSAMEDLDRGRAAGPLVRLLVERGILTQSRAEDLYAILKAGPPESKESLPSEVQAAMLRPEARFGRYVLVRELGRGGMGVVHRAWQEDLGRWVAVKRLGRFDPAAVTRFVREGKLAARVVHPHLVSIYEVGEVAGEPFIAMALLEGGSLEGQKLPVPRALEIMAGISRAVQDLHVAGIIHRDIKPGNLLIDSAGRVSLGDFGLARHDAGPAMTRQGVMIGTPAYAAPEQVQGNPDEVGPTSDVWALGATLYSLLTGDLPFSGSTAVEVSRKVVDSEPPALRIVAPAVPSEVETVVNKAMRKAPAERYRSARDFADDLDRCLRGELPTARPPSGWKRSARFVRRHRPLLGLAIVVAVVIGIASILLVRAGTTADIEKRKTVRLDLGWRLESAARDALEWAEVRCRTHLGAEPAERAKRRKELEASLESVEGSAADPDPAGALLARFDHLLADDPESGDAAFSRLSNSDDPFVRLHRARARMSHLLSRLPQPIIVNAASGQTIVIPPRGFSDKAAVAAIREDFRAAAGRFRDLEKLLRGYEALLSDFPGSALGPLREVGPELAHEALDLAGFAALLGGDLKGAVESWGRVVSLRPGRFDVKLWRSVLLSMDPATLAEAESEVSRVLLEMPTLAWALACRGMVSQRLAFHQMTSGGNFEAIIAHLRQSEADFRAAIAAGIRSPSVHMGLSTVIALTADAGPPRDRRTALRAAVMVLDGMPIDPGPQAVAIESQRQGQMAGYLVLLADDSRRFGTPKEAARYYGEAIACLDRLLAGTPAEPARAHLLRGLSGEGRFRIEGGDPVPARAIFEADFAKSVELAPDWADGRHLIATAMLRHHQAFGHASSLDTALSHASKAVEAGRIPRGAWNIRAEIHNEIARVSGNTPRGLDHFRRAILDCDQALAENKDAETLSLRARSASGAALMDAAAKTQLLDRAAQDLDAACDLAPDDAELPYLSGLLRLQMGQRPAAAALFRRALDLNPSASLKTKIEAWLEKSTEPNPR